MESLRLKIQQQIDQIRKGQYSQKIVDELISEIRAAIKNNPEHARELGSLIPVINKNLQQREKLPEIKWLPVGKGHLAIGHKPGGKISFEGMRQTGVTAVLTLLNENEGAQSIGKALKSNDIEWLWLPFSASNPHEGERKHEVIAMFEKIRNLLESEGRLYIHCSAGIHRTGMVSYALLRFLGQDKALALQNLAHLRQITAEGATKERLLWGDQFAGDL